MKVLIAGGAGFIGSTVASACLDDGLVPVVLDNLVTGRVEFTRGRIFYQGDIADGAVVDRVFADAPRHRRRDPHCGHPGGRIRGGRGRAVPRLRRPRRAQRRPPLRVQLLGRHLPPGR